MSVLILNYLVHNYIIPENNEKPGNPGSFLYFTQKEVEIDQKGGKELRSYLSFRVGNPRLEDQACYIGDVVNIEGAAFLEQGPVRDFTIDQSENHITRLAFSMLGFITVCSMVYNLE